MTDETLPAGRSVTNPQVPYYRSVQEAWLSSLASIARFGTEVAGVTQASSVGSAFGQASRPFRELIAWSFGVTEPRRRLTLSSERPIDLGYALGNVLWALSGSDCAEAVGFYNPNAARYSDDGTSLFAAPGARIFRSQAGDQFEQAARRLRSDPSSRRAVIETYLPIDLFAETRDCSCLTHLQFFLRDGALTCVAYMRSQSALMVLPYDLVLLTMIHEAMAVRIGARLGPYLHCCGSLHYYLDEEQTVRGVLAESAPSPEAMAPMTASDPTVRRQLAAAERHLRTSLLCEPARPVDFSGAGLDAYWVGVLSATVAGVRSRRGLPAPPTGPQVVPAEYIPILGARVSRELALRTEM